MRLIEEVLSRLKAMRKGDPLELVYAKFPADEQAHKYVADFTYLADFLLDARPINEYTLMELGFKSIIPGRWVNGKVVVNLYAEGTMPEVRVDANDAYIGVTTTAPLNLLTLILGNQ